MRLTLAARKSDLARLQALQVGEALSRLRPEWQIEYAFRESMGDKNLSDPLWQAPEKGVFTEDFQRDLIEGRADLVVHSWKDLPVLERRETLVAATLPRADARDLLLFKRSHAQRVKASGQLCVLSSSPRRSLNLAGFASRFFPFPVGHTDFVPVRGNIQTRVRKLLEDSPADALIMAKAALDRLLSAPWPEFKPGQDFLRQALAQLDWMVLPLSLNPTAAAQGALAIEVRRDRPELLEALAELNDGPSFEAASRERAILASHGGGCHQAIGISVLSLGQGTVLSLRGKTEAGQCLDSWSLETGGASSLRGLRGLDVGRDFFKAQRQALPFELKAGDWDGLLLAKEDSYPEGLDFKGLLWAAGLKTWEKLAKRGLWVNGCQDSLGEDLPLGLEALAPGACFAKLTHDNGPERAMPVIATYQLRLEPKADPSTLLDYQAFWWSSNAYFLEALALQPGILARQHACGPGNTARAVHQALVAQGLDPASYLSIHLNAQAWEAACRP